MQARPWHAHGGQHAHLIDLGPGAWSTLQQRLGKGALAAARHAHQEQHDPFLRTQVAATAAGCSCSKRGRASGRGRAAGASLGGGCLGDSHRLRLASAEQREGVPRRQQRALACAPQQAQRGGSGTCCVCSVPAARMGCPHVPRHAPAHLVAAAGRARPPHSAPAWGCSSPCAQA